MGGQGLPDRTDVVLLAFHRKQHGALDRGRLDLAALIGEFAERQRVILEHQLDSLEIKFRREIEHGKIFVVERLGLGDLGLLALGDILVEFAMRLDVALACSCS